MSKAETEALMEIAETEKTGESIEERYRKAVDAYNHLEKRETIAAVRDTFRELGDYKQAKTYMQRCERFLEFQVGETVVFGNYKGNPLRWKVLAKEGRKFLLLSEDVIDHIPFHFERSEATWSNCSLRSWLNRQFMEEAFTLQERMSILLIHHQNNIDPRWDNNNGADTKDKAFVFNLKELNEYLPDIKDRAIGDWWWLRGHGCSNTNQQAVYADGTVYADGVGSHHDDVGVRAAMWVNVRF